MLGPGCRVKMVKVGLVTVSLMPSPRARPWTNVVLPTPRSPCNASVVSGGSAAPNAWARARVSSALAVVTPARSLSKVFVTTVVFEGSASVHRGARRQEAADAGQACIGKSGMPGAEQVVVDLFMRQSNPAFLIYTGIFAAIAGPIVEELFFRGFLYNAFKKYAGVFWSTIITAVLFAGLHAHAVGFFPIVVLGLALTYLYENTGTLVPSITLHAIHNLSMVLLVFLAKKLQV